MHRIPVLKIIKRLIRWLSKTILFLFFFYISAMSIDASKFISYETSSKFSHWLYGYSSQENFDDLFFFTDIVMSTLSAVFLYVISAKIIYKIRSR